MTLTEAVKQALRRGYVNQPLVPTHVAMVSAALMGRNIPSLPVFRKP
jgi:hypothetical protein